MPWELLANKARRDVAPRPGRARPAVARIARMRARRPGREGPRGSGHSSAVSSKSRYADAGGCPMNAPFREPDCCAAATSSRARSAASGGFSPRYACRFRVSGLLGRTAAAAWTARPLQLGVGEGADCVRVRRVPHEVGHQQAKQAQAQAASPPRNLGGVTT